MKPSMLVYILVMASVTYLVRMLPFVLVRGKIRSRFIRSFLYYVPYAVLGAMTIPGVFYSAASVGSAAVGFAAAVLLSWKRRPLILTAAVSCAAAYAASFVF